MAGKMTSTSLAIGTGIVLTLAAVVVSNAAETVADAIRLQDRAVQYEDQGRYLDAEPLYKQSLGIIEKVQGAKHPNVARALNSLAALYYRQSRYRDAEPLYKRSLEIKEKALGATHPDLAVSLNNLGNLLHIQGRYADAEPLYKRSLAIQENAVGATHQSVAVSLNSLAALYSDQGRYADAEPLYKRSLEIREKVLGSNSREVTSSLHNLANLYVEQGRYSEAEPLYKRSLNTREKLLGASHPDLGPTLNKLGALYRIQGRYADAEPLYKRSLEIREKAFGEIHRDVAASLQGLGNLYFDQGRYVDAEPLYKRSLVIAEKVFGPNHQDVATVLNNLASLYRNESRYADAEALHKRSLEIKEKSLGRDHPDVTASLTNLGALYQVQGRYSEAEPLYKRSLEIKEKMLGRNHPDIAGVLSNLAVLYKNSGRYADAERLHKQSLEISERALGAQHPDVATTLNNIGSLYDSQRRYAEAEPFYKRSLGIREKSLTAAHPNVAQTLNNLVFLYGAQGRYADALPLVRRTMTQQQSDASFSFSVLEGAQSAKLIDEAESFSSSYEILQFTSSSAAAEAVTKLAQRFAAGSGSLADLVRREQDLGVEIDRLDRAIIAAVSKPPSQRDGIAEDKIRARLSSFRAERAQVSEVLSRKFPDYVALSKPAPLTLNETQKLLTGDEAVVAFYVGEYRSYAWVVTKEESVWRRLSTNSKMLHQQVTQLRQSLTAVDKPFDVAVSHKLYQQIVAPIAKDISSKKRLSIVANGALTSIPFSLLVSTDPSGKRLTTVDWLIRSHAITVIPSIYSLKTMRSRAAASSAPKPMIAFADPVFSKTAKAQAKFEGVAIRSVADLYRGTQLNVQALAEAMPQLPSTRVEVQTIGKELGVSSSEIRLGLDATETAVKGAALDEYRIVYFATHGLVSGDLEKFSKVKAEPALAMSIPDNPTDLDDGLLQSSEIAQRKLNADWAVLSACNTASSDGVGAEALSGLARAFLYAGARSLVVSHWAVDDKVTANLMINLFQTKKRQPELSHGEALQIAILRVLDAAKSDDDAHPRLWAPFIVVGEPAR